MRHQILWLSAQEPFEEGALHSIIQFALRNHELERRRKASEARHRTLTEAISQKVWAASESGLAIYFNSQWVAYTGMQMKESLGEFLAGNINSVEQARFQVAWLHATAGKLREKPRQILLRQDRPSEKIQKVRYSA